MMHESHNDEVIEQLNRQFALAGMARFEPGEGGLVRLNVDFPTAQADIYLHGAHVTHYRRHDSPPLLFTSACSEFNRETPIRGGVPVIFPWFGPRSGHPSAPLHGLARTRKWSVESVRISPDGVVACFTLASDAETRDLWPHDFSLRYSVTVGASLGLSLQVQNTCQRSFTFEEALHTYLAVGDVRNVEIEGLSDIEYIDKTDNQARKRQKDSSLRIAGETDRVYLGTQDECVVHDPAMNRRIRVGKEGSGTTVVWNPWIAKSKALSDFGDEEWPKMLCIETANVVDNAIELAPGQTHLMRARITAENL